MYLREQSWRNSFALKRGENWCGDVVMWWCGYVVMRWKSRIRNLRHWVLCKTTAPIDNATLTDTIFFSPTLKGGKLFIVSCEFWVFLYAKIFFIFIMFLSEQSWRNSFAMKWGGKCVYLSITKFTELGWNDCVFERTEEHQRFYGKYTDFSVYVCRKEPILL